MTFMWDPFTDFQRFERGLAPLRNGRVAAHFQPAVDVLELEDAFLVRADLPGVKREELDISFEEDVLTLRGERKAQPVEGARATLTERAQGTFVRKFAIPQGVDAEAIEASFVDGVLSIKLPKKPHVKARRIEVKGN